MKVSGRKSELIDRLMGREDKGRRYDGVDSDETEEGLKKLTNIVFSTCARYLKKRRKRGTGYNKTNPKSTWKRNETDTIMTRNKEGEGAGRERRRHNKSCHLQSQDC